MATGVALAMHHGVTWASLAVPGYGRTLAAKLIVFALVLAVSGAHGYLWGTGRKRAARSLALASLGGSVVIVLLATALVGSQAAGPLRGSCPALSRNCGSAQGGPPECGWIGQRWCVAAIMTAALSPVPCVFARQTAAGLFPPKYLTEGVSFDYAQR